MEWGGGRARAKDGESPGASGLQPTQGECCGPEVKAVSCPPLGPAQRLLELCEGRRQCGSRSPQQHGTFQLAGEAGMCL